MRLKVLASGSAGNSYILESETEALVIEAGVPFKELIRYVDYRKIVGCLVSHEHKDHAGYVGQYIMRGIKVYSPYTVNRNEEVLRFGGFNYIPFKNHHDVPCYGFKINHKGLGQLIFGTDTGYIEYTFKETNHWLIECNYSKEILDEHVDNGLNPVLADRIVRDHMSLETCKDFLQANDLSKTRNIVLLHLSDSNSHAEEFKREIHELTNKSTYIAEKGLEIDLSLCPF
ncbi:MBL fold metallo-hydrolase [Niameybacter massiliensis]|uniref:MBL fold metallo-hydrolase n=1 Tax=Holtiella tumoricola TaxID=3018743 RepID=A0AA42DNR6_9FIRM|nr:MULTISPECIES: hypothetical protein [Lachnospirales]MDA3732355.1 MBL fold metallo-hydrolase [Holtiella tumoricola]